MRRKENVIMKAFAESLYKYMGNNPFVDNQGRQFSDTKIQKEFFPTSSFWSLFNSQHEILIGTRGSGKTFLLRMMRVSMLANLNNDDAKELIAKKEFFSFYVPLHLETINALKDSRIPEERQIQLFKFVLNVILASSIVEELTYFFDSIEDEDERTSASIKAASEIAKAWFDDYKGGLIDLCDLSMMIGNLSNRFDYVKGDINQIPTVFIEFIATPLKAIVPLLKKYYKIKNDEYTWIICIDEAEFIPEIFQKCLNSFMRSTTKHIALKIATLPYYWSTMETLDPNHSVSSENDFHYHCVDMECDGEEFKELTNKLCSHRIHSRYDQNAQVTCLEDFLGTVGNDNLIDYYRNIVGEEAAVKQIVIDNIKEEFSEQKREGSENYASPEKSVHQKYAPILYVRQIYGMKHMRGKGRFVPGWYAGADVVRKISQGNPRLFIRLMGSLFKSATENHFSLKTQQTVIEKFANDICESSFSIEQYGPHIERILKKTGEFLHDKVHNGPLLEVGCSFVLSYMNDEEFELWKKWLQRAAAFSKIVIVNEEDLVGGLKKDSVIALSYAYAAKYWLPMRKDSPITISTSFRRGKENEGGQITLSEYADECKI